MLRPWGGPEHPYVRIGRAYGAAIISEVRR
jgi:hypothetical protein